MSQQTQQTPARVWIVWDVYSDSREISRVFGSKEAMLTWMDALPESDGYEPDLQVEEHALLGV